MGRLRAEESARVREDLIERGLAAFRERGFHATGIQEIAAAAGIPKGSFYNYFPSKDAFAAEVIAHYAAGYAAAWDARMALRPRGPGGPTGSLEALRTLFGMLIEFHRATDFAQGCLLGNLAGEVAADNDVCRAAMVEAADAIRGRLAALLADAQREGAARGDLDAEGLADFFWNAWSGALLEAKTRRSAGPLERTLTWLIDRFIAQRTT